MKDSARHSVGCECDMKGSVHDSIGCKVPSRLTDDSLILFEFEINNPRCSLELKLAV
jgi:hypothetical protein